MDRKPSLTLITQPQEYFRELVTDALNQKHISTRPETEFYLVNLLNQFMTTDRLYGQDADGHLRDEPLALMFKEALEQTGEKEQRLLLRQIGDVSLYTAGFFQDSLTRKLVDVDYYVDLGGKAYQQAASRNTEASLRSVFEELADRFGTFVEVLAEIGDRTTVKSEKDLLRLYELWMRTESDRAARTLQEAGITPNKTLKKTIQ